ncbi:glutamate--cysteine ligase [Psychrosphaera sp.]|nr:glutamate--cysteine ligase [Psychrosphaera sp.]
MTTIKNRLEKLSSVDFTNALKDIKRGIERETLRVSPNGKISQAVHPEVLGATLTHPYITTDYSEALLELITPPSNNIDTTYTQLFDIHHFVSQHIGDEMLWPMSMPCFIENQDEIPLAYFGESNVGKMKHTYRKGLKNRYGSMMQAIAGIHYNFSLPESFWAALKKEEGEYKGGCIGEFQSEQYMRMVRNIKRYVWVVTYLFGASPAMCRSFLEGKGGAIPFEKLGKGSVYLPHATSLRMSDLGYTNSEQSALNVEYGCLKEYIEKLRIAIRTESLDYKKLGVKENGEYKQLNHNILQIENELYAPVRPKQVAKSGEKPTDALENRGIMYVELRALDVNPFSPVGISKEQMRVIDVFMLFCLLTEQDELSQEQQAESEENQDRIVLNGRADYLELIKDGEAVSRTEWLSSIFEEMKEISLWLDGHLGNSDYSNAISNIWDWKDDPSKTLSGQLLDTLLSKNTDNGYYALALADEYKQKHAEHSPSIFTPDFLLAEGVDSIKARKEIEANDKVSFDEFLEKYFALDS